MNSHPLRRSTLELYGMLSGRQILRRLRELENSQWLDSDSIRALLRQKLVRLTAYAAEFVPFYQQTFQRVGFDPSDLEQDLSSLEKLPILTKNDVRQNVDQMMTTEPKRRSRLRQRMTSGSTGQPLTFYQDTNHRDFATADTLRHLEWANWEFGDPHAFIWGAGYESTQAFSLRDYLMDLTFNRFATNAYVLSDASLTPFAERLKRRRSKLLFGYASSLYAFARFVHRKQIHVDLEGAFSAAELLYDEQREFIEQTLGCHVFDTYGLRELGGVGYECTEQSGLHISVENNYVEILKDGTPTQPGQVGEVVVTNLNNLGMPFIRYRTGDMGMWQPDTDCPCGRALPRIKLVSGRQINMFRSRDGRIVWGGFGRLFHIPHVKQFQVVQESFDLIVIRIVESGPIEQSTLDHIQDTVKEALGQDVQVTFEFLEEIPPHASGKHLYAISHVDDSAR